MESRLTVRNFHCITSQIHKVAGIPAAPAGTTDHLRVGEMEGGGSYVGATVAVVRQSSKADIQLGNLSHAILYGNCGCDGCLPQIEHVVKRNEPGWRRISICIDIQPERPANISGDAVTIGRVGGPPSAITTCG